MVGTAYGIYGEGIIKTGNGNDQIIATSTLDGVQHKITIGGGINIALGAGNDYFKGFGKQLLMAEMVLTPSISRLSSALNS